MIILICGKVRTSGYWYNYTLALSLSVSLSGELTVLYGTVTREYRYGTVPYRTYNLFRSNSDIMIGQSVRKYSCNFFGDTLQYGTVLNISTVLFLRSSSSTGNLPQQDQHYLFLAPYCVTYVLRHKTDIKTTQ